MYFCIERCLIHKDHGTIISKRGNDFKLVQPTFLSHISKGSKILVITIYFTIGIYDIETLELKNTILLPSSQPLLKYAGYRDIACIIENLLVLKYRDEVMIIDISRLDQEELPVIRKIPADKSENLSIFSINLTWKAKRATVGPRGVDINLSYLERN